MADSWPPIPVLPAGDADVRLTQPQLLVKDVIQFGNKILAGVHDHVPLRQFVQQRGNPAEADDLRSRSQNRHDAQRDPSSVI